MSAPVTVRMYRGFLGDCFLITAGQAGSESHILIDFGILQGTSGAPTRMREVASDIWQRTGGKLDLLVVTHEHFDHIAGFKFASGWFFDVIEAPDEAAFRNGRKIEIGELWLGWTEDPDDSMGVSLQERFAAGHQKLAALRIALDVPTPVAGDVFGLPAFEGVDEDPAALAAGKKPRNSREIYAQLKAVAGGITYLSPGHVLDTPGNNGLRAHVLGPPRDEKLLFKALPSSGEAKETYLGIDASGGDNARAQARSPFSDRYRWRTLEQLSPATPRDLSPAETFLREHYVDAITPCRFAGRTAPAGHACAQDFLCGRWQGYRQIGNVMAPVENALAIRMDSNTNNSSLVIAFALPDGTTMLFAADAQVGNWLSWEKVDYADHKTRAKLDITTAQLLARARLYKVGHHGSHNATLKGQGLELMTHPELVVLIPTDEAFALQQGSKGWLMPNPETYKGLIRQSRGRILRSDLKVPEVRARLEGLLESDDDLADVDLADFEAGAVTETDLYCDFHIVR
ncbi:hypothetical protein FHS96_000815 [Sphingomonas zeicaulis]|uniref:MBL fold metallo-hydrolase n=1 Tax=Sphingomonas zeicaulis TaxID=1632740 RepID=UPI003D1AC7BC